MIAQTLETYRCLGEIPWMSAVLRAGTSVGPPPLVLAESFLSAALEAGIAPDCAFGLWRSTWFLVCGELQWGQNVRAAPAEPLVLPPSEPWTTDEFSTIRQFASRWPEFHAQFTIGPHVAALIDGTILAAGPSSQVS
ncbi:hypothetical protein ACWDPV_01590 [Gordonia sp. NPDC003504]